MMPAVQGGPQPTRASGSRCQKASIDVSLATIFASEVTGAAVLILLGTGVEANNLLPKSKGHGSGTLHINIGWGFAVFAGVLVSGASGAPT